MLVDLKGATLERFVDALFNHDVGAPGTTPWYLGSGLDFEIEPQLQVRLIAELFRDAELLWDKYSAAQIEQGLWCMMGDAHVELFTGLIWNPALSFHVRVSVVAGIHSLYDKVLACSPFEPIDFRHPDLSPRRFRTIDYMAPDLLLHAPWFPQVDAADQVRIRDEVFRVLNRLLQHPAPVAQYAALHGLGHLDHPGQWTAIERYLAEHPTATEEQRAYALSAQRGDVL